MGDRKYDYDKIYDELYDDEPDDILSMKINKDLIEKQRSSTVEEKLIANNNVAINQVNPMPSEKPLLEIHEKNDIMTEMENAHSKNKETTIDCMQANGNINDLKKMDLHFDASIQANNSTRIKNECSVDVLADTNSLDTHVTTEGISQLKKEEKEAMQKENGGETQKNDKEINTLEKTSVKEERYNIYEHGTFNSKTEVLKKEGINDIHNKGEEASQDDRTMRNDASETMNSTEHAEDKKDKSESRNTFECNICFDDVRDPVVTKCGHLFCWSCLSSWIKKNNDCPVCKAEVLKETVIPLYGRGTRSNDHAYKNATDEPRPKPNRKEPSVRTRPGNNNVGLRTLGVWVNPFSFALSYTNMSEEPYFGDNTTENRRIQTETYQAEIASSLFFF